MPTDSPTDIGIIAPNRLERVARLDSTPPRIQSNPYLSFPRRGTDMLTFEPDNRIALHVPRFRIFPPRYSKVNGYSVLSDLLHPLVNDRYSFVTLGPLNARLLRKLLKQSSNENSRLAGTTIHRGTGRVCLESVVEPR